MSFFEPIFHAFGLDIGDRSIKAVDLYPSLVPHAPPKAGMKLRSWNQLHVPEGIIEAGDIKDRKAVVTLLRSLMKTASPRHIRGANVVASLPESKTFVKTIEISRLEPSKIAAAVAAEAEQHIPMPLAEASFDWQIIGSTGAGDRLRVIVGAVPKDIADLYTSTIEEAGLSVFALEIEAVAIARSLIPGSGGRQPAQTPTGAVAIIDIGATRSSFIVASGGTILLTIDIPLSGNDMTARISERLNIDWNESEKLKIACGLDPSKCAVKLRTLVEDLINELVAAIRKSLRFSRTYIAEGGIVDNVLLTGGGANIAKLENILSQKLLLRVRKGDPASRLMLPGNFPVSHANSFSTAIGLALRAGSVAQDVLERNGQT